MRSLMLVFLIFGLWQSAAHAGRVDAIADTTIYVAVGGNDANDGLTPQTPKATTNAAIKLIQTGYDLHGFIFRIQHAPSAVCYPAVAIRGAFVGAVERVRIVGSTTRGAVCINSGGAADAVAVDTGAEILIEGFTLYSTGVQLHSTGSASRLYYRDIEFTATSGSHVSSEKLGYTYYVNVRDDGSRSSYFISGGAARHLYVNGGANAYLTETINGSCINFTAAVGFQTFANVIQGGNLTAHTNCWTGPAPAGAQMWVQWNSVGANASQLPGDSTQNVTDVSSHLTN